MYCSPDRLGLDPKFLNTIYNQYLQYSQPVEVAISAVSDSTEVDGEHFTSHTKRVRLECLSSGGRRMTAPMIIKIQKNWDNEIQARNYNALFKTEIKIYTTILPLMKDIMTRSCDKREFIWPDLYGCQSSSLIALQDLTTLGYAVQDRRTGLNLKDTLLVVQNIARFHAMSKLLMNRGSVSLPTCKDSEIVVDHIYRALFIALWDSMRTDWSEEWSPMMHWIRAKHEEVLHRVKQMLLKYDKRFEVINHGDLWTSNIMFKCTESETHPTSVRFVDYQLCNVNSFIWDLEFFYWTSVDPNVRIPSKNVVLAEYQTALVSNLKLFGYSGYIPTLEDVTAESKRIEIAGLVFLLFGAVVRNTVPRAIEMEKLLTHYPLEVVNKAIFSNQKAQQIVGQDLKYLTQCGVISSLP